MEQMLTNWKDVQEHLKIKLHQTADWLSKSVAECLSECDDDVLVNPTSDEWRVAISHTGVEHTG